METLGAIKIWYEIQYSKSAEEDWCSAETCDTAAGIKKTLRRYQNSNTEYKYRAVRKTLSEEVIADY